ncbi:MAG: DUF433 domain-containing protein [Chloroflexi bacterium]|nr:DUF433 domain-containing protein [Chloroflexota bacterium]MCY3583593.1 DUF433 domain-containing protein [Chloroflexota bacterium]MCY3715763.1 DUF433 domain-containing protein [Chloroflexota bacterium]MDE2651509.1 DUF433 domain-containing protein [Chloroflexota bacterium]MXX49862.1 DUF433 domain-containing protein [Chloroflexota bacterium]
MIEIQSPGITRIERICGGRPCIAGTRLRVTDIVTAVQLDYSRSEIAADFDISREQVDAALAYYQLNKAAIDADIKLQDETFERHSATGYGRPRVAILSR